MTYTIAVCTEKTPDDGKMNCPKRVDFYSKNKFENLVHLIYFITRIYHDVRSPERQILNHKKNAVNLSILLTSLMHPVDGCSTTAMMFIPYYIIQFLSRSRVKFVGL